MGNGKENSNIISRINSAKQEVIQEFDLIKYNREMKEAANREYWDNMKRERELENEETKQEFIQMGVVRLFTEIIESRVLSSLWDEPEKATYNFLGMKKIIKPAVYGEKELIVFGYNMISLDLHGDNYEGNEVPRDTAWTDYEGPPDYRCSRINVNRVQNGEYWVSFNHFNHYRDRRICDRLSGYKVDKDEVVDAIVKLVATYIAIYQQEKNYLSKR